MKTLTQGKYVWGEWKKLFKQGKLVSTIEIVPIKEYQGMYRINPPSIDVLPRNPNSENYPEFWVDKLDVVEYVPTPPPPVPTPNEISDYDVSLAIVTLLKWLKQ
jgi:hypothetical protein